MLLGETLMLTLIGTGLGSRDVAQAILERIRADVSDFRAGFSLPLFWHSSAQRSARYTRHYDP
jgi:hypothetical protein